LGEAIGKGGFATVYRALDTERGDFVAIKQIEKRSCKNTLGFRWRLLCSQMRTRRLLAPEQTPKIMQEAELLKKLSHPNVVGFRGSVETPKHIHFVLEFVEGGSLFRVVKKFGTFTEKLCAIYMKQVSKKEEGSK
jgi:serine/threonine protein kinase